MHSITKTRMSASAVRAIASANLQEYGKLESFQEMKDGMFNAAYLLRLDSGRRFVLKIAPHPSVRLLRYEHKLMQAEVEVMRLVRAKTSIPIPEILVYDQSCRHAPSELYIMDFVPGTAFNKLRETLSPEAARRIEFEMGRLTQVLNSLTGKSFGYPMGMKFGRWREAFAAMMEDLLRDGEEAGIMLPRPYAACRETFAAAYPALDEVREPCLVHWDLWDGNVFVDPDSLEITGLIDFERALWAEPLMENKLLDFDPKSCYMKGYGEQLLVTPAQHTRRSLYNLYLFLIMIIESTYRQFDSPAQENWAREMAANEFVRLDSLIKAA